jgi:hypothetical protein
MRYGRKFPRLWTFLPWPGPSPFQTGNSKLNAKFQELDNKGNIPLSVYIYEQSLKNSHNKQGAGQGTPATG